jgi:hypothetical protein
MTLRATSNPEAFWHFFVAPHSIERYHHAKLARQAREVVMANPHFVVFGPLGRRITNLSVGTAQGGVIVVDCAESRL